MHSMFESVMSGATTPEISGVDVRSVAALNATAADVLGADGYLLGTPANLGYMSGALKHFFDTIYYPCLDATAGRPYGMWLHGENDTDGARLAVEKIVTGLGWKLAQQPLVVLGAPSTADLEACWELGASVAAQLATGN